MSGLLKNNLYTAFSGVKLFAVVMAFLGVFVTAVISQPLLTGYAVVCMVGFPLVSIFSFSKENTCKWSKYKLTMPVRRADIIKSYFSSQLIWLLIGIAIAGIAIGLSFLLHGFPFDRNQDICLIITLGIGISLFMNAIFFPLYYSGDGEKGEVFAMISLLCSIGIIMGLSSLINWLFGDNMTNLQLFLGAAGIMLCAVGSLCVSFPLTVFVFKRKEY